jgi:hypothetical protein
LNEKREKAKEYKLEKMRVMVEQFKREKEILEKENAHYE